MSHSQSKDHGSIQRVGTLVTDSGAAAMNAAEAFIESLARQVTDAAIRLRRKQPLISVTLVVVKNNNLASPLGQVGGPEPQDES